MRRAVHDDVARGPDAGHQADEAQERHRGRGTAPCRRCGLQASREPSSSAGPYDHPPAPPDLFSRPPAAGKERRTLAAAGVSARSAGRQCQQDGKQQSQQSHDTHAYGHIRGWRRARPCLRGGGNVSARRTARRERSVQPRKSSAAWATSAGFSSCTNRRPPGSSTSRASGSCFTILRAYSTGKVGSSAPQIS